MSINQSINQELRKRTCKCVTAELLQARPTSFTVLWARKSVIDDNVRVRFSEEARIKTSYIGLYIIGYMISTGSIAFTWIDF